MHFHALLHNYLNVPVSGAQISGLNGSFRDKVAGREEAAASGSAPLTMDGAETDRVYADRDTVEARSAAGRGVKLSRSADGFAQTVLWNPGEKGAGMKDMHKEGETEFVCVEPGYVAELKALAAGEEVSRAVACAMRARHADLLWLALVGRRTDALPSVDRNCKRWNSNACD